MFCRTTSRRKLPSLETLLAIVAPGFLTSTASCENPASRSGLRNKPPFAMGLALIRRLPFGANAFNSGMNRPFLSNNSSGL